MSEPRAVATSVGGPLGPALADAIADTGFTGVVLAVGPGGVAAEVSQGIADRATGRPITPSSRFGTASVGKLFTAVTLVRQLEQGRATLATALGDVLPAAERPVRLDPRVTLEHLLTHTSGIADYCDEYGDEDYADVWRRANPVTMEGPRDLLALFRDLPPMAPPGAGARYCNAAFVLLGLVVEALSGLDFYEAVRAAVLEPAGMASTGYWRLDEVIPDLAIGYLPPVEGSAVPREAAWRSNVLAMPVRGQPDGGAFSTAADLVRFLDAFEAGRLVSTEWREEMLRPRVRDEREGVAYGLTWWLGGEGARRFRGHPGGDPGYVAWCRSYPEAGLRLVTLANREGVTTAAIRAAEAVLLP